MKSMLVKDCMSRNLLTLRPDMDIIEAVSILCEKSIPGAPVVDQLGNLIGFLAEKDCLNVVLNAVYFEEKGGPVESFMHRNVEVVESDSSVTDVAKRFIENSFRGMPVVDENRLVGIINRSDILNAIIKFIP